MFVVDDEDADQLAERGRSSCHPSLIAMLRSLGFAP
jgi:hypothetical protein